MDMVIEPPPPQPQQLDPNLLKNTTLWLNQDEEEEEEVVGLDLLTRHKLGSNQPPNGVESTPTTPAADLEPSLTSGTTTEEGEKKDELAIVNVVRRGDVRVVGGEKKDELAIVNGVRRGDVRVVGWGDYGEGDGHSVYFDKLEGTESTNETKVLSSSPAPVKHFHEETNGSIEHIEKETEVDANVDSFGEIEEDLVDLDVEGVIEKQNTHDLFCPNCKSCITKRVILVRRRRRTKVSIRQKPKHGSRLDPVPSSAGLGGTDDTPEMHSDVSPDVAPDEQINSREQERKREAFSCLSCFSIFIPIGNGCFKILQFFTQGRQTERAQSPQEIRQRESTESQPEIRQSEQHTESPQGIISPGENTQSPQEIRQRESTESQPEIRQSEQHTESPQGIISPGKNTQSPQGISPDVKTQSPQGIISQNGNAETLQQASHNEATQSPHDTNRNDVKKIPQKIPRDRTSWVLSFFRYGEHKETVQAGGHTTVVQSAQVSTSSVIDAGYINGAAINPKVPGISGIFPSTTSDLLDKLKPKPAEQKPDAGDNGIKDIETGLLEPLLPPSTEVAPSSQTRTETEGRGADAGEVHEWEILKSIVYGGLIESITSLGVVSSAAGAGADTLNILALGVANLIGGLILISHNLRDLKNDQSRGASDVEEDRYQALLGRRQNFVLHAFLVILSFLVFGLVPPVVYGFSFRKSDDKDLKLAAVAGASLICIFFLALGKGHIKKPHRAYFSTLSYYIGLGITASGLSYIVGQLINKLLEQLGLFEPSSTVSMPFLETVPMVAGQAFY